MNNSALRFFALSGITALFSISITFAQQGMGVGNSNPLEMLHVTGAIKVGTDFNNSNAAPTGGAGTIRFKAGQFEGWDGTTWTPLGGGADLDWATSGANIYNGNSGNVGIGTSTPNAKLNVAASSGVVLQLDRANAQPTIEAGTTANNWLIMDGNVANSGRVGLNWFSAGNVLLANGGGNVGIGTAAPTTKLHIEGAIRMVDGNQAPGYIPVSNANGVMIWTDPTTISDGDWTVNGND